MSEGYVDHVLTKINRRNRKFGDEWPSSDSEDPDYSPFGDQSSKNTYDSESGGSTDVEEDKHHSIKVTSKRKRTSTARTSSQKKDSDHGSNTDLRRSTGTPSSHVKNNKCLKNSAKRQKTANPNKANNSTFSYGTRSDNTSSVECPHLPLELWLKVFQSVVQNAGPLPFLCRAAKVCRSWHQLCCHPSVWYKVDLSYGWIKSTDATLLWLSQHRLAHCREINLAGWKKLTNSAFVVSIILILCSVLLIIKYPLLQ